MKAAILTCGLLTSLSGCGCTDVTSVRVAGQATQDGKPVADLMVFFIREGKPLRCWGQTDAQGRFELQSEEGNRVVPRGKYKVWVEYQPSAADPAAIIEKADAEPDMERLDKILEKYGDRTTTPLEIEISHAEENLPLVLD